MIIRVLSRGNGSREWEVSLKSYPLQIFECAVFFLKVHRMLAFGCALRAAAPGHVTKGRRPMYIS